MTGDQLKLLAEHVRDNLRTLGAPTEGIPATKELHRICFRMCAKLTLPPDDLADLVADALWNYPRAQWIVEIAGPHWMAPSLHELDDARDIASVDGPDGWGHAGTAPE